MTQAYRWFNSGLLRFGIVKLVQSKGIDFSDLGGTPVNETQWEDVPGNALKDIKGGLQGMAEMGKNALDPTGVGRAIMDKSTQPIEDAALAPFNQAKGMVNQVVDTVSNPVETFKQHPVNTALLAAPVIGKMMPEAASMAEAPKAAPEAPPMGAEAPKVAEAPNAPPPQPNAPQPNLGGIADTLAGKANDVKNYISHSYQNMASKPGVPAEIADYLQGKSQMFAARDVGITPLQARQLGHEGTRAVGQYAIEHGYEDATSGLEGKRRLNSQLLNKAGNTLDDIRSSADKTGKVYQPGELLNSVKSQLDQKYLKGVTPENTSPRGIHGSQAGEYQRALQEVEDFDNTHVGAAKVATELNKFANKANKLKQPTSAYTDVANAISRINNDRIQNPVPQKAPIYEQALREYGVNKKIGAGLERKSAGEVKREGPGSLTSNLFQKALDEAGYRVGAKATNKVSTAIKSNPGIAKSLPSLFKEFIHHVEEEGDEVGQ